MRSLRHWAETALASRPEVLEIVLIGSLARGDWSARSDADIVVVVADSDLPFRARSSDYAPRAELGIGVDPFVYTEAERAGWGSRFRAAVEDGERLWRRRSR